MPILKVGINPDSLLHNCTSHFIIIKNTETAPTPDSRLDDTHLAVVDLLPLVPEGSHIKTQTLKTPEFIQAAKLIPRLLGEPGAGIGVRVVQAHASRQKKAPIALIHL